MRPNRNSKNYKIRGRFLTNEHRKMSAKAAAGIFIVGAKRTPFGSFGGKLSKMTPTGIAIASKGLESKYTAGMNLDLLLRFCLSFRITDACKFQYCMHIFRFFPFLRNSYNCNDFVFISQVVVSKIYVQFHQNQPSNKPRLIQS